MFLYMRHLILHIFLGTIGMVISKLFYLYYFYLHKVNFDASHKDNYINKLAIYQTWIPISGKFYHCHEDPVINHSF